MRIDYDIQGFIILMKTKGFIRNERVLILSERKMFWDNFASKYSFKEYIVLNKPIFFYLVVEIWGCHN